MCEVLKEDAVADAGPVSIGYSKGWTECSSACSITGLIVFNGYDKTSSNTFQTAAFPSVGYPLPPAPATPLPVRLPDLPPSLYTLLGFENLSVSFGPQSMEQYLIWGHLTTIP